MLKRKLNEVLFDIKPKPVPKPDFGAQQELRGKINALLRLPLKEFCRTRPDFDAKHGLVYKLLKTDQKRLKDSTLCSHDVSMWLRDHKSSIPALWIIKLAGADVGNVSRNQLLKWLKNRGETSNMLQVYRWTKKWGFKDNEYTKMIIASPKTAEEARLLYKDFKQETKSAKSKQILANNLLSEVLKNTPWETGANSEEWANEVFSLFKTLNKDLITFQIMFGGMVKHKALRMYFQSVWDVLKKHEEANNVHMDSKLSETCDRVKKLIHANKN